MTKRTAKTKRSEESKRKKAAANRSYMRRIRREQKNFNLPVSMR